MFSFIPKSLADNETIFQNVLGDFKLLKRVLIQLLPHNTDTSATGVVILSSSGSKKAQLPFCTSIGPVKGSRYLLWRFFITSPRLP